MGERSTVSVAVCTYNGETYIREQLESILNQDYPVDEVILGDDGSTDRTVAIAKEVLEGSSVSYEILVNQKNLGYRKNFEQAIAKSKGDIIFLSDQDDVWKREKVARMVDCFQAHPECLFLFSDAEVADEHLQPQKLSLWDAVALPQENLEEVDWCELFLKGGYVTGAASAFRRELFEQTAPFSERCVHDAWLAMAAALQGGLLALPEKLFSYRQHASNQIGVSYSVMDRFRKRREILKNLSEKQMKDHRDKVFIFEEMQERFGFFIKERPDFQRHLAECIAFHKSLSEIPEKSFFKGYQEILKYYRHHDYDRFAKTKGVCLGDFLCLFMRRKGGEERRES